MIPAKVGRNGNGKIRSKVVYMEKYLAYVGWDQTERAMVVTSSNMVGMFQIGEVYNELQGATVFEMIFAACYLHRPAWMFVDGLLPRLKEQKHETMVQMVKQAYGLCSSSSYYYYYS